MTYQLSIQRIQGICLFDLTWGRGQRLRVQVPYPAQLDTRYRQWQRVYVNFYKQALRGRVGAIGQVTPASPDLHSQLVQAEARLLSEFHRWLQQGELTDIRKTLSVAARETSLDLFLTCDPIETARLPWETWEIGSEFGGAHIRISRSPNNIRVAPPAAATRHRKTRVLVILGDETGLNFAGDKRALQAIQSLVEITFVGWTPGQDTVALKQEICQEIANPLGWDILFFAGHSNEADAVAGHIYIAPQTGIAIRELQPYLQTAQANGLQFALFNSCCGLTIADALIELGLSQVAIMREPIHNQVAQQFLLQFLQSLATHCDVQDALREACRHLKLEHHLTYPSAYLVPSLFRHPDSVPFRIPPRGWRQALQKWLPNYAQAIALSTVVLLSVLPGVQETLLSGRLLAQAMYRNLTGQIPTATPEVVLVQIDEASRRESPDLANISPLHLGYLAKLLDSLTQLQAKVIGIDYLLDFPQPDNAPTLAATVRQSVNEAAVWFVFGSILEGGQETGVNPASNIIDGAWAMEGYTNSPQWYMALPWEPDACQKTVCPLPFLLALTARHQQTSPRVTPALTRQTPLRADLMAEIGTSKDPTLEAISQRRIAPITAFGGRLRQRWLRPILDFSLPPDRIFHRLSAYEVLEQASNAETTSAIANASVVIIGGVGYVEGGVDPLLSDISPNPPAIAYWRQRGRDNSQEQTFAGVEAIAYDVHHHLQAHLVTPIPALWLVGIALWVGSAIALYGVPQLKTRQRGMLLLVGLTMGYGWLTLQAMISTSWVLPWLLPGATVWIYGLPSVWRLPKS
ncbi:MAG: CHASE2 domain-containing protein [Leptolyngbya sp. SIO1D8]|nr:CHASE2 domain-containing protein [Leptolyngbya sp. SIO1D8]